MSFATFCEDSGVNSQNSPAMWEEAVRKKKCLLPSFFFLLLIFKFSQSAKIKAEKKVQIATQRLGCKVVDVSINFQDE